MSLSRFSALKKSTASKSSKVTSLADSVHEPRKTFGPSGDSHMPQRLLQNHSKCVHGANCPQAAAHRAKCKAGSVSSWQWHPLPRSTVRNDLLSSTLLTKMAMIPSTSRLPGRCVSVTYFGEDNLDNSNDCSNVFTPNSIKQHLASLPQKHGLQADQARPQSCHLILRFGSTSFNDLTLTVTGTFPMMDTMTG